MKTIRRNKRSRDTVVQMNSRVVNSRFAERRGVLLLVCLSMLTLFVLLGTTYIVFASRTRTTARAFLNLANEQRLANQSMRPMIQEAARQVMRGSSSISPLDEHDLLADRYGGSRENTVGNAIFKAGGQLIELTLNESIPEARLGQVVTFYSGDSLPAELTLHSTRVVDLNRSLNRITIRAPRQINGASQQAASQQYNIPANELKGATLILNDPDFSGRGFGDAYWDMANDRVDAQAMHPNWSVLVPTGGPSQSAHEDYDAVDEQNIALAPIDSTDSANASYHRAEIVNYWIREFARQHEKAGNGRYTEAVAIDRINALLEDHTLASTDYEREVVRNLRQASLRPFAYDHYQTAGLLDFTGKEISVDTLRGVNGLDVDNDADGVLDSVWVDFGASAFRLSDTTLVKPLAAIRCLDLGGRLGLNSVGSISQIAQNLGISSSDLQKLRVTESDLEKRPVGMGFGQADIRPDAVISPNQFSAMMNGDTAISASGSGVYRRMGNFVGRYGDGIGTLSSPSFPGVPGVADQRNGISKNLWPDRGVPANWWNEDQSANLYMSSPPDLWSRVFVGIDQRGHPAFLRRSVGGFLAETTDYPYETDLTVARNGNSYVQSTAERFTDQPFTAVELEAVLRRYDADSAGLLPQRMLALLLGNSGNPDLVTADTWDTPAIIGSIPTVTDVGETNLDLVAGLRLNLNRPFGDGEDNDSDQIVDEPDETSDPYHVAIDSNESAPEEGSGWNLTRGLVEYVIDNGNRTNYYPQQPGPAIPGLRARQIMAHNLFQLMEWIRGLHPQGESQNSNDPGLWLFTLKQVDRKDGLNDGLEALDKNLESNLADQRTHARKTLAQWAINVVDFLDADSIMTPYRYEDGNGDDNVVWGCEQPDLIITETLAFHDRGIADTTEDNGDYQQGEDGSVGDGDNDFDQVRVPQGSLFLELYGTRNPQSPHLPAELYENSRLTLGKTPTGNSNDEPIWRLALSELRKTNDKQKDLFHHLTECPDTLSLDPHDSADGSYIKFKRGGNSTQIHFDRYVWFRNGNPSVVATYGGPTNDNTFRLTGNAGGSNSLIPGNYLVAGPREKTIIGSEKDDSGEYYKPAKQKIEITANSAKITDLNGDTKGLYSETQGCWLESSKPAGWSTNHSVGLNISEKLASNYYPQPPSSSTASPSLPYAKPFQDEPQDDGSDLATHDLLAQGTHSNVATVFVQRLADPTRVHDPRALLRDANGDPRPNTTNPNWNPYVVVDFMPIDLTVFNGESEDRDPAVEVDKPIYFHTRQRGFDDYFPYENVGTSSGFAQNPWRPCSPYKKNRTDIQPPQPIETDADNSADAYFSHSLGLGNGDLDDDAGTDDVNAPTHTLGWCNSSWGSRQSNGAPSNRLPWIVWNDRPFANEYELLHVPRTSAGRLLTNYRSIDSTLPVQSEVDNNGDYVQGQYDAYVDNGEDIYHPFGAVFPGHHLLPLTPITDIPLGSDLRPRNCGILGRMFSYVRVPSLFAGTSTALDSSSSDTPAKFRVPFNRLPTFREPGRVNINTTPTGSNGAGLWRALGGVTSQSNANEYGLPEWNSIRSFTEKNVQYTAEIKAKLRSPYRSLQANPGHSSFSSEGGYNEGDNTGTAFENNPVMTSGAWYSSTKVKESDVASLTPRALTLFGGDADSPLFASGTTTVPAFDPKLSSWFRFDPLIRASSQTTTRSEVYAIWVTVGLFEVADVTDDNTGIPTTIDSLNAGGADVTRYPADNFRIVREYGSTSGDVTRHRGFYIFDRSIPVGYESGADHNIEDAILVERFIE